VAAGDDLQRVELQIFHGPHGCLGAFCAAPAPARPQALSAENKSSGGFDGDGEHVEIYCRGASLIYIHRLG